VSGDGSIASRPRERASPERKPAVPRLANVAQTALAQAAYEAAGLGARREMELVAANQTLQAQVRAIVSAASEREQGVTREVELVVATERAEAAARVAAIQVQATVVLATERTR
jgi:hypothetical protein